MKECDLIYLQGLYLLSFSYEQELNCECHATKEMYIAFTCVQVPHMFFFKFIYE